MSEFLSFEVARATNFNCQKKCVRYMHDARVLRLSKFARRHARPFFPQTWHALSSRTNINTTISENAECRIGRIECISRPKCLDDCYFAIQKGAFVVTKEVTVPTS